MIQIKKCLLLSLHLNGHHSAPASLQVITVTSVSPIFLLLNTFFFRHHVACFLFNLQSPSLFNAYISLCQTYSHGLRNKLIPSLYNSFFLSFFNSHIIYIFTMNSHKAYLVLMALELTCIGIKYGVSDNTNPFQHSTPTILLFLTAMISHVLASTADMTHQTTTLTFHVSGVVGCQTLLWIIVAQVMWYYVINLLLLLVASFRFFNYVTQLLSATPSNANDLMSNTELQSQEAQV